MTSLLPLLLELIRDAFSVLRWRLPVLFALSLVSAVLEGLTLALLLPLLAVVGLGGGPGAQDRVTAVIIAAFKAAGIAFTAPNVGLLLLIPLAASAAVFLLQAYFAVGLQARYVAHWNHLLFRTIMTSRWDFLRRCRTGTIVSALTKDSDNLGEAFNQANFIVAALAFTAIQLLIATIIAPMVAVAILVFAVILFAVTQTLVRRALALTHEVLACYGTRQSVAIELLTSAKLVKATATEGEAMRVFNAVEDRIERLIFASGFDVQIVRAIFEYSSGVAVALLLVAGPLYLGVEIGTIIVVLAMFVRLFPKVTAMRRSVQSLAMALPSFDSLVRLRREAEAAREPGAGGAVARPRGEPAAIRLDGVQVVGDEGQVLLDAIDLDIAAGEFVAVFGPTGAGKSTLIDTILGLAQPAAGIVKIDGKPLTIQSNVAWRSSVGYLGQDPVLFAGTIRDNVAWGRVHDEGAIIAALEAAGAGFVFKLPAGIDTPVTERGGILSGGERQRIALARALAGNSRLLVLDEATSALDADTEQGVVRSLAALQGKVTIIAVTHRPALIEAADVAVALEEGRVVAVGNPRDLWTHDTRLRRLVGDDEAAAITASGVRG